MTIHSMPQKRTLVCVRTRFDGSIHPLQVPYVKYVSALTSTPAILNLGGKKAVAKFRISEASGHAEMPELLC